MTKMFTHWDQDALRKAMAATVLPSQKPKRAVKKHAISARKNSFSTRCLNAMEPGEIYRSRELAELLDVTVRRVANAMSSLVYQGRVERVSQAKGVGLFRRVK